MTMNSEGSLQAITIQNYRKTIERIIIKLEQIHEKLVIMCVRVTFQPLVVHQTMERIQLIYLYLLL